MGGRRRIQTAQDMTDGIGMGREQFHIGKSGDQRGNGRPKRSVLLGYGDRRRPVGAPGAGGRRCRGVGAVVAVEGASVDEDDAADRGVRGGGHILGGGWVRE